MLINDMGEQNKHFRLSNCFFFHHIYSLYVMLEFFKHFILQVSNNHLVICTKKQNQQKGPDSKIRSVELHCKNVLKMSKNFLK